jgi:predicted amidophosphoribosyltransferase
MDRLNVRNIMRRKKHKLQDNNYSCVLCSASCEETTFHLFLFCQFSQAYWSHLGIFWNYNLPFHAMIEEAKDQCTHTFFMEFFIIAAWTIWKQRKDLIFNRKLPSFLGWKRSFCNEAYLQATKNDCSMTFLNLLANYKQPFFFLFLYSVLCVVRALLATMYKLMLFHLIESSI